MRFEREDLWGFALSVFLCSTPVGYLVFEFMLPNVSYLAFGKNLLVILILSVVAGVPAGLLNRKTNLAIVSVFVYTVIGYLLAFLFYMIPFVAYGATLAIPGLYYVAFLRFTVVLAFVFLFGGIIGVVAGQYLRDSMDREETKLLWGEKPGT